MRQKRRANTPRHCRQARKNLHEPSGSPNNERLSFGCTCPGRTVIRYWPVADRWLIDREGVQESAVRCLCCPPVHAKNLAP